MCSYFSFGGKRLEMQHVVCSLKFKKIAYVAYTKYIKPYSLFLLKRKVCHCFKFSKRLDYAFGYLILLNLCFVKSTDHCVYDLIPVNLLSVRICNTTKLCEIRSSLIRMNFQLSYAKNQKIK
jgi:hypothetical protein